MIDDVRDLVESLAGRNEKGEGSGRGRPGPRITEFARVTGLSPTTVEKHVNGRKKPGTVVGLLYEVYGVGGKTLYNKMKKFREKEV